MNRQAWAYIVAIQEALNDIGDAIDAGRGTEAVPEFHDIDHYLDVIKAIIDGAHDGNVGHMTHNHMTHNHMTHNHRITEGVKTYD